MIATVEFRARARSNACSIGFAGGGCGGAVKLRPQSPALYHDAGYIFYAMGLLAAREPVVALRLLKKSLVNHG